jgi:HlyD family secretion protein
LLRRNLVRRTDVLAVRRAEARMTGELGQLLSRISDSRERIARAEQQIAQLKSAAVQKAVEELRLAETEHDDLREQIRAARDIAERIEIAAPVRGIVVKLNHNTSGGVIAPGAPILDLLPINNELVIESRVMPADISHVKEGQLAQVRISALNQRVTPMIDARVVYVSADAVSDQDPRKLAIPQATNQGMFVVRIRIDDADLLAKAGEFRPTPGMPADVFIRTEQRTFFQYLMKPIVDSFSRAFREN